MSILPGKVRCLTLVVRFYVAKVAMIDKHKLDFFYKQAIHWEFIR